MDQTKEINEILKLLPLILVLMLIIQGYWLITTSLFPKFINKTRSNYKKPILITLVGLAVIIPTYFLGFKFLASISNPIVQALGFFISISPIIVGIAGSAGLCQLIGYGLPSPTDQSQNWKRVWRGGWVLNFCCLLPFIGWLAFLWAITSGCGAFILSLVPNKATNNKRVTGRISRNPARKAAIKTKNTELKKDSPRAIRQQKSQIPSRDTDNNQKRHRNQNSPRTPKSE